MAKKNEIAKDILYALAAVGIITLAVALPGLPAAFGMFLKSKKYKNNQLRQSLKNLKKRKLIGIGREGDKILITLTKNGRQKILKYKLDDMKMSKPRSWDKKWRLVIFDIPEDRKMNRTMFVYKLKELGFAPLQKSVWVWPYDCEDEVDFLKEIYEVGAFVRVIRADYIDIEKDLLDKFNL